MFQVSPAKAESPFRNSSTFQQHPDVSIFHFDLQPWMDEGFAGLVLPGRDIELPTVPGASDDAALQLSFSQWTPLMGANAVKRVQRTVNIEQRHDSSLHHALQSRAGRAVAKRGKTVPGRHREVTSG